MDGNALLEIDSLSKQFGSTAALSNVSLRVSRGEVFGLVGPNGAGKSTLLKSVVGLVRISSGHISVDGFDPNRQGVELRRRISFLPGEGNTYLGMKGGDFLDFALSGYSRIDEKLLGELHASFPLPLNKKIRSYSAGMKRQLLLIQALSPATPLILLDEPTEALDPSHRLFLLSLIQRLAREGRSIVFSSHQLDEVESVCHRVAFLHQGKLLDCDSIEGIREKSSRWIRVSLKKGADASVLKISGVKSLRARADYFLIEVESNPHSVIRELSQLPILSLEFNRTRLSELYADLYGVQS